MRLPRFLRPNPTRAQASDVYARIVLQAREPAFYGDAGVPDTLDGRFDLLILHCFLVMRRLGREEGDEAAKALSQAIYDVMFADFDRTLREMGVGDVGVGKRVNQMSKAFFGRVAAYEDAMASGEEAKLADALRRNLFGTIKPAATVLDNMCAYILRADKALAAQPAAALLRGEVQFVEPPGGVAPRQ